MARALVMVAFLYYFQKVLCHAKIHLLHPKIIKNKQIWFDKIAQGAKASAMYYSIVESTKANDLNPYEYFKYLMEQLKEYLRNNVPKERLMELMPWSDSLPDCCRELKKDN